jgi:hypothetical protein
MSSVEATASPGSKEPASEDPAVAPIFYLLAVTITGIAGAAWVVGSLPGVGLVLLACLAALSLIAGGGLELKAWTLVFGTLGLALVSTVALRDAIWLVFPNLAFALVLAAFAVRPPATWGEAVTSLCSPPIRAFSTPAYLFRSAGELVRGLKLKTLAPLTRGLVMGGTLVAVFWGLFASADRAFLEVSKRLVPDWDLGLWPPRVGFFIFVVAVTSAFHLAALLPFPKYLQDLIEQIGPKDRWRPKKTEWVTALALLNLLFMSFVAVQAVVLFAGHDHILRTANLSYAEYARQGFFQLLLTATLTVAVVTVAWNRAQHPEGKDLALLRALLGLLCLLTFVVLVSALRRLGLYEEAFGLTRLRLSAHAFGLWLGGVFVALLLAGATLRTRWLARGIIVFTACSLLVFSSVNPDAMIASRNLGRYRETGKIDLPYLAGLSADAIPELVRAPLLSPPALARFERQLSEDEPWSSFNLSRERARRVLGID